MLALTGRKADGWLPSLGYVDPADLAPGNAIIDEAAAAGRHPGDIRRLLNITGEFVSRGTGLLTGPPAQWASELAELALRDGISVFILGSDDPTAIERFGQEVAPAVRELVEAQRRQPGGPATSGPATPAAQPATPTPTAQSATPAAPEPADDGDLGVTPTPDTGERLSDARLWDESTRPSRPRAPADAVYTDRGRAVASHLIDVHDHLRAELTQIRELIDQVRDGAIGAARARSVINEMTMRQNDWTLGAYCASYCRIVAQHHTLEDDAIFPYLRTRERGLEPVIDRLAEEHKIIHHVLEGVEPLAKYGFYAGQL